MRMAIVFGMNQVVSHGFGLFLFAALVPMMRDATGLSYWYLALAGALTQLAYLAGALFLGLIGPRLGTRVVALVSGVVSTSLLFTIPLLRDPVHIIVALVCLAASAAMSWGAIVEIISRCAPLNRRATYLSSASSGTAWGYGINGLIILWIVPMWGWENAWRLAGAIGTLVLCLTVYTLRRLQTPERHSVGADVQAIALSKLMRTLLTERTAFLACAICFLVGFCTMPFSNWLNTYLAELKLPVDLGGYSWSTVGVTGMLAGFAIGKLADHRGHASALLLIFGMFALSQLAFAYNPAATVLFASFGYGLMYFPMWGVVAGWVNQQYSSAATMQISGICMVTFGLGGALGNLLLGVIRDVTGGLKPGFVLLSLVSLGLAGLGLYIRSSAAVTGATEAAQAG